MQNTSVDKLIEIVKAKIFIKFHAKKVMMNLAWVAHSMAIFSASYADADADSLYSPFFAVIVSVIASVPLIFADS